MQSALKENKNHATGDIGLTTDCVGYLKENNVELMIHNINYRE